MNIQDVEGRLEYIEKIKGDPEEAHICADRLMEDVLTAIANGKVDDPQALANVTLRVTKIKFSKWYA